MVTYCMYGLFGFIGLANLYAGRWGVALFYAVLIGVGVWFDRAVLIGVGVWFDRKLARDIRAHDRKLARDIRAHEARMAKLDERAKRWAQEAEGCKAEVSERNRRFLIENYVITIVIPRAEFLPLTPDREASLRAEFDEAASQCLHNLRG